VQVGAAAEMYRVTDRPVHVRDRAQITELFDGFELVEPGVVYTPEWHPDASDEVAEPGRSAALGGVGKKII
jgi:hypothetical protein